jgi:hypothetical protein
LKKKIIIKSLKSQTNFNQPRTAIRGRRDRDRMVVG